MGLPCMNVRSHEIGSGSGMEAADVAVVLRLFLGQAEECPGVLYTSFTWVSLVLSSYFRMGHRKQRLARNSICHRVLTGVFIGFLLSEHRHVPVTTWSS